MLRSQIIHQGFSAMLELSRKVRESPEIPAKSLLDWGEQSMR